MKIGPTFFDEIRAAGLGPELNIQWNETTGEVFSVGLSPAQQATLDAVKAAHDPVKSELSVYAAQKRWEKETGGIVLNGVPVGTDDRSKLMIMGVRLRAAGNPDLIENWAPGNGNIYPLNASQLIAISDAVGQHVSACFATYSQVKANIDSGVITTKEQVDAAFANQ